MNAAIANVFGYVLNFIYGIVQNYGVSVIILSILLKLLMLPITIKQLRSQKKSSKIQEKVKQLQIKYSSDPEKLNAETFALYKREKYSPWSGCLTSILQLIIFISIFYLVSRPLTYMKKVDSEVINNYITQIQEEGANVNYPEIKVIQRFGAEDERVNLNMNFLGLDLSDVPSQNYSNWKVFIIPILYVITSIISTKITTSLNKANKNEKVNNIESKENIVENNEDKELVVKKEDKEADAMEEMNKQMTIMMPIMSVSIALIAPLGLALYWLISNLLMICERLIINKFFKEGE